MKDRDNNNYNCIGSLFISTNGAEYVKFGQLKIKRVARSYMYKNVTILMHLGIIILLL
jgi:hypothetical protein